MLYRYEKRPSNIVEFCNSCWKTAKNAPFHKSRLKKFSWSGQRGGESHHDPPPKYATDANVIYTYLLIKLRAVPELLRPTVKRDIPIKF